jgi:hypothetical protein
MHRADTYRPPRQPPKAGTVWARPRPKVGEVQSLGVGSFGKLYLATDLKTGEEVAVKAETDLGKKTSPLRQEAEVHFFCSTLVSCADAAVSAVLSAGGLPGPHNPSMLRPLTRPREEADA